MSIFIRKSALFGTTLAQANNLGFPTNPDACFTLRWLSSNPKSLKNTAFTFSYLSNTLGLSPKDALSASKLVTFPTSEQPDKAIDFLKGFGFTHGQISTLIRKFPSLLLHDSEDNRALPVLKFLKARGFSNPDIARIVIAFPGFLGRNLITEIIPSFELYKEIFGSDEKVNSAFKQYPDFLSRDVEKYLKPKIAILREHGVPEIGIVTLFRHKPGLIAVSLDRFRGIVERVVGMGFDSKKPRFVGAVQVIGSMSKSRWEGKIAAYKKWGLSEEEVLDAFGRLPRCMQTSADKIAKVMGFFVNEMGYSPSQVIDRPMLLNFSLEKRLIPRRVIYRALLSKGLVDEKEIDLGVLFEYSEKRFLSRFLEPYVREAPELLKLYREKLNLSSGPENLAV